MTKHPSLDIVESYGTELSGKKIVLCVAGSVAAYKSIELARLLMRHGADVKCVMSGASTKLIKPDYMKWATGNNVITKLTGNMEHIDLADYKRSDLIIVYPSTANTLGKLANGIDEVVDANQSIFDSVDTIVVTPIRIISNGIDYVSAELEIVVNDEETLLVTDILEFDDDKINSVRAYRG